MGGSKGTGACNYGLHCPIPKILKQYLLLGSPFRASDPCMSVIRPFLSACTVLTLLVLLLLHAAETVGLH